MIIPADRPVFLTSSAPAVAGPPVDRYQPTAAGGAQLYNRGDADKQRRIEWLRQEIQRLRGVLDNYGARVRELNQQLYQLNNEIQSLRTELDRVNYSAQSVNGTIRDLESRRDDYRSRLNYCPPNEREYWRNEIARVNDEIGRTRSYLQGLQDRRDDLQYKIQDRVSRRDSFVRDRDYYDNEIQKERYNLQARQEELRNLQG